MPDVSSEVSLYRFAPAISARIVGALLVVLAVLLAVATLVVAIAGLPLLVLVAAAVIGVAAVFAVGHLLTRRVPVVRLDAAGYRVRLVRGVGVGAATWIEVAEGGHRRRPGACPWWCSSWSTVGRRPSRSPCSTWTASSSCATSRAHLRRGQGLRPLD